VSVALLWLAVAGGIVSLLLLELLKFLKFPKIVFIPRRVTIIIIVWVTVSITSIHSAVEATSSPMVRASAWFRLFTMAGGGTACRVIPVAVMWRKIPG
jgi:hypothetical protein